ncbi:MAG: hypothetical protein RLZZ84_340, partial [Pseudomonadota bacterium]
MKVQGRQAVNKTVLQIVGGAIVVVAAAAVPAIGQRSSLAMLDQI